MSMRNETEFKLNNAVSAIGNQWFTRDWYEQFRASYPSDELPSFETLKKYLNIESEEREQVLERYQVPDDLPDFLDMVNSFAGDDLWQCTFYYRYRDGWIEDTRIVRYYHIADSFGF